MKKIDLDFLAKKYYKMIRIRIKIEEKLRSVEKYGKEKHSISKVCH